MKQAAFAKASPSESARNGTKGVRNLALVLPALSPSKPEHVAQKLSVPDKKTHKLRFIDLFAGIGGFHLAMHQLNAECVFASEWDECARKTYEANFKSISSDLFANNRFVGDITQISPESIPDFDVLCAGFPCQPFSQAGFKKGFDETRGTLFFNIVDILRAKQPQAFFLENVRHLLKHDNGRTFSVIESVIKSLGYSFYYKIIKASDFGLPQHRPRLFMIGFKDPSVAFQFPEPLELCFTMSDVLRGECPRKIGYTLRVGGKGSGVHDRRNWDTYVVNNEVRRLSVAEGQMMQGFPDDFEFPVSQTQAMKQLGNSVAVPAVKAVAERILLALRAQK